MRTTIDIDENLLKKAMELTHTKIKKEVVNLSLNEIIRNRLLEELAAMGGNYELDLTLSDLEEMRRDEHISLNEMVRARRLKELADMVGNYEIDLTLSDLEEMRRDEHLLPSN